MSEWDQRQLCPDGACVGVIGSDGTCKVCGRAAPNWGDERKRGLIDPDAESSDASRPPASITKAKNDALYFDVDPNADDEDEDEYDDDDEGDDDDDEAAASPEWEQRKLCPDDACIGVIGDNGMCKVCGRAGEDNQAEDESEHEDEDEDENEDADEAGDEDAVAAHASTAAPEWDDRKLCPDEACTGLIGPNGRCKVCNRSAA